MDIPYYIFAIIYIIILVLYFAFVFFSVYHMIRFGFYDFVAKLHTALLASVVAVVLIFTMLFLRDIQWAETFSVLDNLTTVELPF